MIVAFRPSPIGLLATTVATARAYLQRTSAYTIQLIRWPLGPLFTFATWRITYGVAGRGHVDGSTISGFLLVGIFGMITWTSSIWASGYALEFERGEGTSASLFLTPASRAAVVTGYGIGSFVWFLPSFAAVGVLGVISGARFDVSDAAAVASAVIALTVASLAAGFTFSGLFILSRKGNLIANVLQSPAYLLGGILIPLASLPSWLRPISNALPITHAMIALRASMLAGAGLHAIGGEVLLTLGVSAIWFVVGLVGLRSVERVAKRTGQLELY